LITYASRAAGRERARSGTERWCICKRLRGVRAVSCECSVGWVRTSESGVIGIVSINVGRAAGARDRDRNAGIDRDRVSGQVHFRAAAERDIGNEV
jgi:hypothetical protein